MYLIFSQFKTQFFRLINFVTNRDVTQSLRVTDDDQVFGKVTEDLAHIEDMLDDCLSSLSHYTGGWISTSLAFARLASLHLQYTQYALQHS